MILAPAQLVCEIVRLDGEIRRNVLRPEGTPRKLMDSGGFRSSGRTPRIDLRTGIAQNYRWFLDNHDCRAVS